MQYFSVRKRERPRLVARTDGEYYDLTSACPEIARFRDLARAASIAETDIDTVAERHIDRAVHLGNSVPGNIRRPLALDEVWAAGVTYAISEEARETESVMPDMYLDVYESERPEIFFKATADRTVGPGEAVGIRGDSDWDVPEPELGIVLYQGDIVGYTVGNDMSSRSIEGRNPLYLPQAKVYDRCCSIGPAISSPDTVGDPHDLQMEISIRRNDEVVYEDATSTSELMRTCSDLVESYVRHNSVPELAVLLTGTALVPDESFTLQESDDVAISIENIGSLRNPVTTV